MGVLPQEIEVWYIIPTLRRELANVMIKDYGINQNKVSKILGISRAAVSQYLKEKRGKKIDLNPPLLKAVKISAKKIVADNRLAMDEVQNLCKTVKDEHLLCEIHHKHDHLPKNCEACFTK